MNNKEFDHLLKRIKEKKDNLTQSEYAQYCEDFKNSVNNLTVRKSTLELWLNLIILRENK